MGISGDEHESLMQEIELTSGDFTRQFVVERGEIIRAAGIELVRYGASVNNPILAEGAGERDCFAMSTRGMCVGISKEIELKIQERNDLYETTQVQAIFELGAIRTEGILVQKVRTTI